MKVVRRGHPAKINTNEVMRLTGATRNRLHAWINEGVFGDLTAGRHAIWDWETHDIECAYVATRMELLEARVPTIRAAMKWVPDPIPTDRWLVVQAEGYLNSVGMATFHLAQRGHLPNALSGGGIAIPLLTYHQLIERAAR